MDRYDWIVFDADETLFEFNSRSGLDLLFSKSNLSFSDEDFLIYHQLNQKCWKQYQEGFITSDDIKRIRFEPFEKKLGKKSELINSDYLMAMLEVCKMLPHSDRVVKYAKNFSKIALITNGFKEWQDLRLKQVGLFDCFQLIVTSEDVGAAKPDPRIFYFALDKMNSPIPSRVLMVGDNLSADIVGGKNVGFDTCWLSRDELDFKPHEKPTYQVKTMAELHQHMLNNFNGASPSSE